MTAVEVDRLRDPWLSIVIAVRNAATTLERCLGSIARQTAAGIEVIVVDGGSTDGTVELLRRHAGTLSYWESSPDRGVADAWNKGIAKASGEWLLFLGADDFLWEVDSLSTIRPILRTVGCRNYVVYGRVFAVNGNGTSLGELSSPWDREKFVYFGMYFSHQGVFHHRRLFEEYGMFDASFRFGPDYELLLRYLIDHDAAYEPAVIVAGMQMGGMSNHPKQAFVALGDLRKARRKLGIKRDAFLYYRALVGAKVKQWLHCLR